LESCKDEEKSFMGCARPASVIKELKIEQHPCLLQNLVGFTSKGVVSGKKRILFLTTVIYEIEVRCIS